MKTFFGSVESKMTEAMIERLEIVYDFKRMLLPAVQKNSLREVFNSQVTFGEGVFVKALESLSLGKGICYKNNSVKFMKTYWGSWALFIIDPVNPPVFDNAKIIGGEGTVLLGKGLNLAVLLGDDPISEWFGGDLFKIEKVSYQVVTHFQNSKVMSYKLLASKVREFKMFSTWDDSSII